MVCEFEPARCPFLRKNWKKLICSWKAESIAEVLNKERKSI